MSSESGAKDKILAGVESIKLANEIKTLFNLCKEAHGTLTQTRTDELKSEFGDAKYNSGTKKEAKEAINKYEKTTGKKYFDEALELVSKAKKEIEASYDELNTKAKT